MVFISSVVIVIKSKLKDLIPQPEVGLEPVGWECDVQDTAAAPAKSLQSCLTLSDPIDGSPPGSPIPGILQARTLEWVAISFSNAQK